MSSDKILLEKYQISQGELSEIKIAHWKFCGEINVHTDYFSMSGIRKFQTEKAADAEHKRKKNQAQQAHARKGFLGRVTSSPESVGYHSTSYEFDRTADMYKTAREAEKNFEFICKAHRLDPTSVFQDIVQYDQTNPQKTADCYRAYCYAKKSSPAHAEFFR